MCNDFEQHVLWGQYCAMMQSLALGIPTHQSELDLPRADDVKINDMAPVMRAAGNEIELAPMNFSLPPSGSKGGPIFNFRSEGRRFGDSKRCLVPASAFFEFSGKKYPKAKHRFTIKDAPFMAIDDGRAAPGFVSPGDGGALSFGAEPRGTRRFIRWRYRCRGGGVNITVSCCRSPMSVSERR